MQKTVYTIFSAILYIASWVLIGYVVLISPKLVTKDYIIESVTIIKMSAMIFLFFMIASGMLLSIIKDLKIRKFITRFTFISLAFTYIMFLCYSLFLSQHAISFDINMLPFKSIAPAIYEILSGSEYSLISLKYIAYYISAFIPLGVFLYLSLDKFKVFNNYFITMVIVIVVSFMIQYFIKTNSFNIDNIILSLFGSIFAYMIIDKIYTGLGRK